MDIDPDIDTPLFLDPYFISKCDFPFAEAAHASIQSYFDHLLALLRTNKDVEAEELFSHLGETNDICMGMSTGKPRGHGMGSEDTTAIFKSLRQSRVILTGVMEDIEDFRIFVPNVDKDKVSDMTANIIKWHLIQYTIEQCHLHDILLTTSVPKNCRSQIKQRQVRWLQRRYMNKVDPEIALGIDFVRVISFHIFRPGIVLENIYVKRLSDISLVS